MGIVSGLVLLDEVKFYNAGKLFGIFVGSIISSIGILIILKKNRLDKDVHVYPKVKILEMLRSPE